VVENKKGGQKETPNSNTEAKKGLDLKKTREVLTAAFKGVGLGGKVGKPNANTMEKGEDRN